MSERVADFLIQLAENDNARAAFEAAPETQMAAHGLTVEEQAAILSGDASCVFALCAAPHATPVVIAKIWTGLEDEPGETPAVAKIWTGLEEEEPQQLPKCA
ncbi:MAG: hypothetical protein ACT4OF_07955 [Caulobacteraceae bacterium]